MPRQFYQIFEMDKRPEAEKAYGEWEKSIPSSLRVWFKDLNRAVTNWKPEIFSYFDFHITNAYTESSNSKTRSIFDDGNGFSSRSKLNRLLEINGKLVIFNGLFSHPINHEIR